MKLNSFRYQHLAGRKCLFMGLLFLVKVCILRSIILFGLVISGAGCSTNTDPNAPKNIVDMPDSSEAELLNEAIDLYERKLFSISREKWSDLRDGFPASVYSVLAELKMADCYYMAGDYSLAVTSYEEFVKLHPAHEAAAYAQFQMARSHLAQYRGIKRDQTPLKLAFNGYKTLLERYSQSEYIPAARDESLRVLELMIKHEQYLVDLYTKLGHDSAARFRRKEVEKLQQQFLDEKSLSKIGKT